ncbi:hypothetical protein V8F33_010792 [Rhypophila sp. PSN 637]
MFRRRLADVPALHSGPTPVKVETRDGSGGGGGGTRVLARQAVQTSTIPSTYGSLYSGPQPGEVVGIVLGSVAGFILILWLIYTCINMGNPSSGTDDVSSVVTRKSRRASHRHSHSHHHHARPRSATVEIRTTTRGPVIVDDVSSSVPDEAIIVEEAIRTRRARSTSRGPPIRRVGSDDEVVVIEEASPSRHRSRRRSGSIRMSSGYREVDPEEMREIRRSISRRRYD